MKRQGSSLVTTHSLPFRITAARDFKLVEPVSHDAEFHGHPFHVTIGAFVEVGGGRFVMVHAERVTDGAHALVYKGLTPAKLDGLAFGMKTQCATLDPGDVTAEFDLHYLAAGGAKLMPAVFIAQYFKTNATHTEEFIVTLGVRVPDCAAPTVAGAADKAVRSMRSQLHLKPMDAH